VIVTAMTVQQLTVLFKWSLVGQYVSVMH
jgi:hypothetical protein